MSKKILVILGSVRPGRAGEKVAAWVMAQSHEYSGELEFELADLLEINLPFLDEPDPPMSGSEYVHEHTRRWSGIVNAADGFIIVTPEYNRGYPPVLKNALDYLYREWKGKPCGFVGYGGSGARSSIRQLREVMESIGFRFVEEQIGIGTVWDAFEKDGVLKADHLHGDPQLLFSQLESILG